MNVVVSEQNVAKELIQARVLASRVIFMPLNRMQANRLPQAKVHELMQLTDNKARLAIDLIEYD